MLKNDQHVSGLCSQEVRQGLQNLLAILEMGLRVLWRELCWISSPDSHCASLLRLLCRQRERMLAQGTAADSPQHAASLALLDEDIVRLELLYRARRAQFITRFSA